ncbi:thiamine phosphate synthase [Acidiferrimicrobium sp. IK]|uniref:thiamine phosphate synthase n=1 Tax=Acidiferrimicrobium sp. IK TaxID=2871700 RepID=UPI0021CB58E3|nr:thiamine phosphate synthase [Acidiferrimicrobium sp. IK]MCU4183509.1 thiamine phosphate synthase [Acidiferrimicrobium sp. IK]
MPGRLHLITDTRSGLDPLAALPAALAAGVDVVQVRMKEATDREVHAATRRVVAMCDAHGATCIVDDRLDVALAAGAAGVHLGAEDLPVADARRVAGAGFVIGATVRDPDAALRAVDDGASYLGVGPAFATSTKAGLPAPLGPAGIAAVCAVAGVPVIAIGGVRAGRVAALMEAGAGGVAVVDAVYGAPDPSDAVRALRAALDEAGA